MANTKLDREEWGQLLALLDTALELPDAAREPWLNTLHATSPQVRSALRQMLQDRRAIETGDFLARGAHLAELADAKSLNDALNDALGDAQSIPPHDIGPWRMLRLLGKGGMASVWLVERADGAHKRQVALKLPEPGTNTPRARVIAERFQRERAILSSLNHANIAQVLDAGVDGAQPWLAMEFIDGVSITVFATEKNLNTRARLRLFLPVLQAVQHAHAQLVIHRDIKPSNVMVDHDGNVKLLDFGVAKLLEPDGTSAETALTEIGGRALTPQYASPEQITGQTLGTASDVYSLGVLLYELLTGTLPYTMKRDTPVALEEAILTAQVQRPSEAKAQPAPDALRIRELRGDVDTIVLKALQVIPALRYSSAEAFAQDIENYLQSRPIVAQPPSLGYRLLKLWGRQRLAILAATAVLLALILGVSVALWQARAAKIEARKSDATKEFLLDLFRAADNRVVGGKERSEKNVLTILDEGGTRLQKSLDDQPEVKFELLFTLAEIYESLDQPARQVALLEQAETIAKRQYGENSETRAQALLGIANSQAWTGRFEEAEQALTRVETMLAALGDTSSVTYATVLKLKGSLLRRHGPSRMAEGRDMLQRAAALFDSKYPRHPERVGALMYLAQAHIVMDEMTEAISAANRAVAAALQVADKSAPLTLANAYSLRASIFERSGALASAIADYREAGGRYRDTVGADHFLTLQNDNLLGQTLHAAGQREAGLALMQQSANAVARIRLGSNTHANTQLRLAQTLLRDGDPDAAIAALSIAEANARARKDVNVQASAVFGLAAAEFALGRDEAARKLVQRSLQIRRDAHAESAAAQADAELLIARIALHNSQYDEAERAISAALTASQREVRPEQIRRAYLLAMQGQVAVQRGDSATALTNTAAALALAALPALATDWALKTEALTERGRALCAAGNMTEGRPLVDEALRLRKQNQRPNSTDIERVSQVQREC